MYKVPQEAKIGHVHLKVSDLERSLTFYKDLLGFLITQRYGSSAVFLSSGAYHHHIAINTWNSKNSDPSPIHSCGLFHVAICYPTRKDLAIIFQRIIDKGYPLTGTTDHGVSEAIYLNDPDDNGIELYWDKPITIWPTDEEGNLEMVTIDLDIPSLLSELSNNL